MNAESQKTVRRDRKAFFSEKCKEIDKNNRMGKTRDHFKKIGDIRGIFHARMGTTKDRNGKDLTETEEILKKVGENAQNSTRKVLMTQLTTMVWSLT